MKAIKVKSTVYDIPGTKYDGVVISFDVSLQPLPELQQRVQEKVLKEQEKAQELQSKGKTQEAAAIMSNLNRMRQMNYGVGNSINELASRDGFLVTKKAYKSVEVMKNDPRRKIELCVTDNAIPLADFVIEMSEEDKKDFGVKLLNKKAIEKFCEIFGEKNVEVIEE